MKGEQSFRWSARLPLILVLVSLVLLAAVPFAFQQRILKLQGEILELAAPARSLVTQIQAALALETSGTRGFLLTREQQYVATHMRAREARLRAFSELAPLAGRLGTPIAAEVSSLGRELRTADALLDALFSGNVTPEAYVQQQLPAQQQRLEAALARASRLEQALTGEIASRAVAIERLERWSALIELLLVLLAFVAALMVGRLGQRLRVLAQRYVTRAHEQESLKGVARTLGTSLSVSEAVETIVKSAVETTRATGAYVEQAEAPGPGTEVEVVAIFGEGAPPLGTRVPYPGSLTEVIIESGEPEIMTEVGAIGERMAPYLRDACRRCSGLVVPLSSEGKVLGALVLLRGAEQPHFSRGEAAHARALGDLASAALRRVLLLEELRESERRFQQITDHLRQVIWLGDPLLTVRYYVNPAYEEVWGRSMESFYREPKSHAEAVHPEDRARLEAAQQGLSQGEIDIEYRIIRPDGEVRWVWSRAYPIRNERGEIYRVAGIVEDITSHKEAEAERERLLQSERAARAATEAARVEAERRREELERVLESRARLMRGFSHDVKNPLGAADGHLQLMQRTKADPLSARQLDRVVQVRRSIRAALELIDDLLELERAETGEVEVNRAPTYLRQVAWAAAEEYRAQAEAAGLSLTVDAPDQLPEIESDDRRIRQIVGNLISNAVKYTSGGRVAVSVSVREDEDAPGPGDWIAIDVTDTGPGIPHAQQRALFQEFRRLETAAGKRGAGIGLAISRRIAHALGGDISVESVVGEGSTFTLWLPIAPAYQHAMPELQPPAG